MVRLELPYPPSVNRYYRHVGGRTLISRDGRVYRRRVQELLAASGIRPTGGRLAIAVDLHPPDRRRRDIDNTQKALLDSLQHGGAYEDDSQIDELTIRRQGVIRHGKVIVHIQPLTP